MLCRLPGQCRLGPFPLIGPGFLTTVVAVHQTHAKSFRTPLPRRLCSPLIRDPMITPESDYKDHASVMCLSQSDLHLTSGHFTSRLCLIPQKRCPIGDMLAGVGWVRPFIP